MKPAKNHPWRAPIPPKDYQRNQQLVPNHARPVRK